MAIYVDQLFHLRSREKKTPHFACNTFLEFNDLASYHYITLIYYK
jgi:hypothetical protein